MTDEELEELRSWRKSVFGEPLETPVFEVHGQDGHVWKVYENGRTEGFPEGSLILNRLFVLEDRLIDVINKFERAVFPKQQS